MWLNMKADRTDTIRRMGLRWRTVVESVEKPTPEAGHESETEMVALRTSMMRVLNGFPAAKAAVLKMFRDLMRTKGDPWWADVEAGGLAYVDA